MPIPRKNQDEFFISGVNEFLHSDSRNEAIIYQPNDNSYDDSIGVGRNIENFEDFISHINAIFSDITRIDLPHSEPFAIIAHVLTDIFLSYLRNFLRSNRSDNIASLAYDLYTDIRRNHTLQNILGISRAHNLQNAVYNYYIELINQNKEE